MIMWLSQWLMVDGESDEGKRNIDRMLEAWDDEAAAASYRWRG